MNSIYTWMQNNMDFVFFVYGLAFIVMGVAILTQPKKRSRFKLANILWFLALFGLTHGTNEFLDMWAIIKGRTPVLDMVRWFMLVISYIFLFEFGRRIFCLNRPKSSYRWLSSLVVLLILIFGFISSDFWKMGSIWARYLLGLPGGVLTAFGFYLHYKYQKKELKPLKVKKYFLLASASFLLYGILGGLVVPKANFFPASWLNTDSFLSVVHIPVQLFRAICAIAAVIGIVPILRIFHWETTTSIRDALEMREKITEGLDEGILLIDRNFKIIWANRKQKEQFGQIAGEYCYRATHRTDIPCRPPHDICPIVEVLRTGKPATATHTHFDKQGNKVTVEVTACPIRDETGEITQFIHVTRDITERKKAEEAQRRLVAIIEATPDFVGFADANDKHIIYVNKAGRKMCGIGNDEDVTKLNISDVHPEWTNKMFAEEILPAAVRDGVWTGECAFLDIRDRHEIPVSMVLSSHKASNGEVEVFSTISRDITEHKKAEEEIQRSYDTQAIINKLLSLSLENFTLEEMLERVIDYITSITWLSLESKGAILLVEDEPKVLVMKAQRGLSAPLQTMCARVPFGRCICGRAALSGEVEFVDCVDERHENTYKGISPHGHYCVPIFFAGKVLGVINTYVKEGHRRTEKEKDFLRGVAAVVAGIIERKRAEQRQAQLLEQLEKTNQELKDFAYIVSHDLKAPLRGIKTLTNWITTDYADKLDDNGKEQMNLLAGRVDRMHNLIDGILQYSRVGRVEEEKVVVNLNELITEAIDMIAPPENITITIENELPTIECEQTRIMQVFQNLLSNAVKYMDKPQGQIKVGCVEEDGFWEFYVADNGLGIEEKYFEKIFQLFQTLAPRDESESTGIGLTIIKKIVEMYGGKTWVQSKVGSGSTFFFTLPKTLSVTNNEKQLLTSSR